MAKFCTNCGKALNEGQKFCIECGTKLEDAQPQASNAAPGVAVGVVGAMASGMTGQPSQPVNTTQSMNQAPSSTMQSPVGQGGAQGAPQFGGQPPFGSQPFGAQSPFGGQQFGAPFGVSAAGTYVPDQGIKEMFLRYDNRLNRKPYIIRNLMLLGAQLLLFVIIGLLGSSGSEAATGFGAIILLASSLSIIPAIFLNIRRLHDLGRSGWWQLVILIPFAYIVLALFLLFAKGTQGPNEYGPDPLG